MLGTSTAPNLSQIAKLLPEIFNVQPVPEGDQLSEPNFIATLSSIIAA